jgi:hypothetical protein
VVSFAVRALLALIPVLTVSFPIKKWAAAAALAAASSFRSDERAAFGSRGDCEASNSFSGGWRNGKGLDTVGPEAAAA